MLISALCHVVPFSKYSYYVLSFGHWDYTVHSCTCFWPTVVRIHHNKSIYPPHSFAWPSWSLHIIIKYKHSSYKEDHINCRSAPYTDLIIKSWLWGSGPLTLHTGGRSLCLLSVSSYIQCVIVSVCLYLKGPVKQTLDSRKQMCSVWIFSGVTSFCWQTESKAKSNQPEKRPQTKSLD